MDSLADGLTDGEADIEALGLADSAAAVYSIYK